MIKGSQLHPTSPTSASPTVFSQEFQQILNNLHNTIKKRHFGFLLYIFQIHWFFLNHIEYSVCKSKALENSRAERWKITTVLPFRSHYYKYILLFFFFSDNFCYLFCKVVVVIFYMQFCVTHFFNLIKFSSFGFFFKIWERDRDSKREHKQGGDGEAGS